MREHSCGKGAETVSHKSYSDETEIVEAKKREFQNIIEQAKKAKEPCDADNAGRLGEEGKKRFAVPVFAKENALEKESFSAETRENTENVSAGNPLAAQPKKEIVPDYKQKIQEARKAQAENQNRAFKSSSPEKIFPLTLKISSIHL